MLYLATFAFHRILQPQNASVTHPLSLWIVKDKRVYLAASKVNEELKKMEKKLDLKKGGHV